MKKKKNKKIFENSNLSSDIISQNQRIAYLFYKNCIYRPFYLNKFKKKSIDIPIHFFCTGHVNKKILDDNQFSIILSLIRQFLRIDKRGKKSLPIFKVIINRSTPLSKIIYQRRGRIFIPLMTYFFRHEIRESLGIKHIFKYCYNIHGLPKNSLKNKIIISLLDILLFKDKYLLQPEINPSTRKEALNKGYIFKTVKPWLRKK